MPIDVTVYCNSLISYTLLTVVHGGGGFFANTKAINAIMYQYIATLPPYGLCNLPLPTLLMCSRVRLAIPATLKDLFVRLNDSLHSVSSVIGILNLRRKIFTGFH